MSGGLKVGMRNDLHFLPCTDDTGNRKPGIQDVPLQEGLRLPPAPRDCPNCARELSWHATKWTPGRQGFCCNCGYSLTVTDDIKRGG